MTSPFYSCSCAYGFFGINCEQATTTSKTTKATTTKNHLICLDKNNVCPQLASYCSLAFNVNGEPVNTYCRKTCSNCAEISPTNSTQICVDLQSNCKYWAGKCSTLPGELLSQCIKTCNLC